MAEQTILIDVQVDNEGVAQKIKETRAAIDALKQQQAELTEAYKRGAITKDEYKQQTAALNKQIREETKVLENNTKVLEISNSEGVKNTQSLDSQRQALATLSKYYASLSGEAKAAAEVQGGLRDKINMLSESVKAQEKAIGQNQRNVGNYPKTFASVIPGFDKLTGAIDKMTVATNMSPSAFAGMARGIGTATKAALKFIATPIGAVIMAVVAAVKLAMAAWDKLSDAIKKNDDASTAIARLYEVTVQPAIDFVTKAFARLADWIGKVAGKLADFLGGSKQAADAAHSLVIATDELQEAERQYVVNSAKRSKEIAELRDKAVQKDKYTAEERRVYLQQAIDLEKQNLEDEKNIKAERLRILEATAKREQDTSDETKDKIAQARADMERAEEAYYSGTRRLNQQLATLNTEIAADEQKRVEEKKKQREQEAAEEQRRAKERKELERRRAETLKQLQQQAEDLRIAAIKDADEKAYQQRKVAGEREIAQLKERLATDAELTEQARETLSVIIASKEKLLQAELTKIVEDGAERRAKEQTEKERKTEQEIVRLRLETMRKGTVEYMQLSLQQLDLQLAEELSKYAKGSEERLLVEKKFQDARAEMEKQYQQQRVQSGMQTAQQLLQQAQAFNSAINDLQNADLQNFKNGQNKKKKALDSRLKSGELSEEEYNKSVQELDEETSRKETELAIEQAKRTKAMNIMQTLMNTATAIMKIWADVPKFDFGASTIALTAVAAALGAAQVAAIAAQPLPQFAEGGAVPGTSYTGDRVLVRANSGEGIFTAKQQARLFDIADGGGVAGGFDYDLMGAKFAEALSNMPAPVMIYREFRDFENNVLNYKELVTI